MPTGHLLLALVATTEALAPASLFGLRPMRPVYHRTRTVVGVADHSVDTPVWAADSQAMWAALDQTEDEEACELILDSPSTMHQPMSTAHTSFSAYADMGFEEEKEEDWWVCPKAMLEANCKEVFHDGQLQVACQY